MTLAPKKSTLGSVKTQILAVKEFRMLVLSRKSGESIRIGDNVVLTVQQIRGKRVHLGIEAPENLAIRRSELPPRPEATAVVLPASPHAAPNQPNETAIV